MPDKRNPSGGRPPAPGAGDNKSGGSRPPARPGGNPENRGPSTGSTGTGTNTKR